MMLMRRRLLALGSGAAVAVLAARGSARAQCFSANVEDLKFKGTFIGQLGPQRPSAAEAQAGTTATGNLIVHGDGVIMQRGPFNSLWIRLGCGPVVAAAASVTTHVREALTSLAAAKNPAAVYVALPERGLEASHISGLLDLGFAYHHYRPQDESSGRGGEFVYYKWPEGAAHGDRVPAYATSIEGVGAVLLSPDEQSVLLVWEYGCWKPPTGAVDLGEGMLHAVTREVYEEVGLAVDTSYAPRYLGGWHTNQSRDQRVNDNFAIFALKALPGTVAVDGSEIVEARWFRIEELVRLCENEGVR